MAKSTIKTVVGRPRSPVWKSGDPIDSSKPKPVSKPKAENK